MANQDSGLVDNTGILTSTTDANILVNSGSIVMTGILSSPQYIDLNLGYMSGSLASIIEANKSQNSGLIEILSELNSTITAIAPELSGSIDITATLDSTVSGNIYLNSYLTMYGFGFIEITGSGINVKCYDLAINMEIQSLRSSGCEIGDSEMITRYRGDDYPIQAILAKNGIYDITGYTFQMSTQIDLGTIYTATGTIVDAVNGIVDFTFPVGSVDIAGEGTYDIEGNDGTYTYTYDSGIFTLLPDLTV